MKSDPFDKLVLFLQNLEQQKISYTVAHNRDEAIMVIVALPGERWELEFLRDGTVEIKKFMSRGDIVGEEAINELFSRYPESENSSLELGLEQSSELIGLSL